MKSFACLVVVLLCAVSLAAGTDFCTDSVPDNKIISTSLFNKEKAVFQAAYSWFKGRTVHADMSNNDTLTSIANDIIAYTQNEIKNPNVSFIVVRSTGAIIIDSSEVPSIYPNIENHMTRYEVGKSHLCREFGTLVFNHYFVARLGGVWRFYGQALQTSTDYEWFVFRINYPFTSFPAH